MALHSQHKRFDCQTKALTQALQSEHNFWISTPAFHSQHKVCCSSQSFVPHSTKVWTKSITAIGILTPNKLYPLNNKFFTFKTKFFCLNTSNSLWTPSVAVSALCFTRKTKIVTVNTSFSLSIQVFWLSTRVYRSQHMFAVSLHMFTLWQKCLTFKHLKFSSQHKDFAILLRNVWVYSRAES